MAPSASTRTRRSLIDPIKNHPIISTRRASSLMLRVQPSGNGITRSRLDTTSRTRTRAASAPSSYRYDCRGSTSTRKRTCTTTTSETTTRASEDMRRATRSGLMAALTPTNTSRADITDGRLELADVCGAGDAAETIRRYLAQADHEPIRLSTNRPTRSLWKQ